MIDEGDIPDIPRAEVDAETVRRFTTERQHFRLAFDLLREVAQWAIVFGSAVTGSLRDWTLPEAVLGAHFVRLSKLLRGFLDQARNNHADAAWVSARLIVECIINVSYMLANLSDELLTSYLSHSLQHERQLLSTIQKNVHERGGRELPIERRMLRSIERTFLNSEMLPEAIPEKKMQNWGGKTLRQKAESIGMLTVYQMAIASSSRNIHGSWHDLLQHHLEVAAPGRFRPNFDSIRVRPQLPLMLAALCLEAFDSYLQALGTAGESRV